MAGYTSIQIPLPLDGRIKKLAKAKASALGFRKLSKADYLTMLVSAEETRQHENQNNQNNQTEATD